MMTLDDLQRILGPYCQPSPGGWLVGSQFSVRVDVDGKIGEIGFDENFPSNIAIEGLRIGMTLDALVKSPFSFRQAPQRPWPFTLTPYEASTPNGNKIVAIVDSTGWVRRLEMIRHGRLYADGNRWLAPILNVSLCSYQDDAELLDNWVGRSTFSSSYSTLQAYANWLQHEATPDQWHQFVIYHNWDDGLEPLFWIICQPNCEKATALLTFFMTRPGQFVEYDSDRSKVPPYALADYDLINEVRRRFLDGFYTRSSIAFDSEQALREETYLPSDADPVAVDRVIPQSMRQSISGRLTDVRPETDPRPTPKLDFCQASQLIPPPLTVEEQLEVERIKQEAALRRRERRN